MNSLTILTHELGQPPVNDGADPANYKGELEMKSMVILERGTQSGDTSVMFRVQDAEGNHYLAQLTGNLFRAACIAFNAADERFKGKQATKN